MAGRILGIDLGTKRIGLALSDPTGTIATPLGKISFKDEPKFLAEIEKIVKEKEISEIVVGYPLRAKGEKGPEAVRAEQLAEKLKAGLGLPVHLCDERLTTWEAEQALRESDLSREQRKEVRDQVAAALILKSFLEQRRSKQ